MRSLIAVLMLAVVVPSAYAGQKKAVEPIRVFVFTAQNPGGFTDDDQKHRTDSVVDLQKAFDKKVVEVVSSPDQADVKLEVLGRGYDETGTTTTTTSRGYYGVWNSSSWNDTVPTVHVGLRAGAYGAMFWGSANPGQLGLAWRTAAKTAASQIEKWIKQNHDTLISKRGEK